MGSQRDRDGQKDHTYAVTPAGEAGLRAWLREPTSDPGLLDRHFAGVVRDFDPDVTAMRRLTLHEARRAEYHRLEQLLTNRPDWRYALATARLGARFEEACIDFWSSVRTREAADGTSRERDEESTTC